MFYTNLTSKYTNLIKQNKLNKNLDKILLGDTNVRLVTTLHLSCYVTKASWDQIWIKYICAECTIIDCKYFYTVYGINKYIKATQ